MVSLRARAPTWPHVRQFYVQFYSDPHACVLTAMWRVTLHGLSRLDVHGKAGDTTCVDLGVPGDAVPRTVRIYSSDMQQLTVRGPNPFALIPRAFNRLRLAWQPLVPGPYTLSLHAVDTETGDLVSAWRVQAHAESPPTPRCYHVVLPASMDVHKVCAMLASAWAGATTS